MEHHQPVMLDEVMEHLNITPHGFYIDATFGRGGHSQAILAKLEPPSVLLALDKDPDAAEVAATIANHSFRFVASSYADLAKVVQKNDLLGRVNGILIDCGVSSPQLDNPERGFSFQSEGPLDMRMDPTQGVTAAEWIAEVKEQDLAQVIKQYGEERYARRVARAIKEAQRTQMITTTTALADIVKCAIPKWEKHKHPATRTFQALRIIINNELNELSQCLDACLSCLASGGRLVVMSFHSLEDKIVKNFMRDQVRGDNFPRELPLTADQLKANFRWVAKRVDPTPTEIRDNPRARSAVLRVVEKL